MFRGISFPLKEAWHVRKSKTKANDQELIQPDPTSHSQKQKGLFFMGVGRFRILRGGQGLEYWGGGGGGGKGGQIPSRHMTS